ncbi:hypothetical protein ACFE04_012914 [Oxalis oulophora]
MSLQISRRPRSYVKRFFSCPNTWDGVGGCRVFIWFDPPEDNNNINDVVTYQSVKNELKNEMGNVTDQIVKLNQIVEDCTAYCCELIPMFNTVKLTLMFNTKHANSL